MPQTNRKQMSKLRTVPPKSFKVDELRPTKGWNLVPVSAHCHGPSFTTYRYRLQREYILTKRTQR